MNLISKILSEKWNSIFKKAGFTSLFLIIVGLIAIKNFRSIMWIQIIELILFVLLMLFYFFSDAGETLGCLKKFLIKAGFSFLILIFILIMIWQLFNINFLLFYVIFCCTLVIAWSFISYISKNSMSLLINEVVSIIVGLLLFAKDAISEIIEPYIEYLIQEVNNSFASAKATNGFHISKELLQSFSIIENGILFCLLLVNGTATVVCLIKKYKIDEENNGVDPFETAYEKYKLEKQENEEKKNRKKRGKQKMTIKD